MQHFEIKPLQAGLAVIDRLVVVVQVQTLAGSIAVANQRIPLIDIGTLQRGHIGDRMENLRRSGR